MINLLKELCTLNGTSGNEGAVREYIISNIKDFCEYKVDALGNIIAFKKGKKTPNKKVMVDAHIDEVGLIITNITADGFLKFKCVGGIDTAVLLARNIIINNSVIGVIGIKPVHLLDEAQRKKLPSADSLYIDIGAKNKESAERLVSVGDTAVICSNFSVNSDIVLSKALDDRIGCATLIKLVKEYDDYDFYATFTVQEEVGLRGAKVATYNVAPDSAIVLEGTTAADIDGVSSDKKVCTLGDGVCVSFMDLSTLYDRKYFEAAKNSGLKMQIKSAVSGGNNAGAVHLSGKGVRTIALSVGCRYIHSASSVASIGDIKSQYDLAKYMLNGILSGEIE